MAEKQTQKKEAEKQIPVTPAGLYEAQIKHMVGGDVLQEWINESPQNAAAYQTFHSGFTSIPAENVAWNAENVKGMKDALPKVSGWAWQVFTHRIVAPVAAVVVGVCMAGGAVAAVQETKGFVNRRRAAKAA